MAVSLTGFSWWIFGGKEKESVVSSAPSQNPNSDWGFGLREMDNVKFPSVNRAKVGHSCRKVKRKWRSREERRIDKEYDVVLVPSDGVSLSGSESDDSDWSVGWMEPHAPGFLSDEDEGGDGSFAVLVRCYRNDVKELTVESNDQLLKVFKNFPAEDSDASKKYMQQWLASLQNF